MSSQLINYEDFDSKGNIPFPDSESKMKFFIKLLIDEINEDRRRIDELEERR